MKPMSTVQGVSTYKFPNFINVRSHDHKHFWLKNRCFDKSILFIFRRFVCHHTHYQGTPFRLKF